MNGHDRTQVADVSASLLMGDTRAERHDVYPRRRPLPDGEVLSESLLARAATARRIVAGAHAMHYLIAIGATVVPNRPADRSMLDTGVMHGPTRPRRPGGRA